MELGATYSEARDWIVWLHTFTPSELADAMAVDDAVGEQFCRAGTFHGIIYDTGDRINGVYDEQGRPKEEAIFSYVPLPPGPTHHPKGPVEWKATRGVGELAPPNRGVPIRLINEKEQRRQMSISGGSGLHKRRQKRYERMMEAVAKRKAAQAQRRSEGVDERAHRKHKAGLKVDW